MSITINDVSKEGVAIGIDECGFLMVCLCDKTCDGHESLKELLNIGYNVLLHVRDSDGNIVLLTVEMLTKGIEQ